MATFLNLNFEKKIYWDFLIKHILFSLLWIFGISILVFRSDFYFLKKLPENMQWISTMMPFLFLILVVAIMSKMRWYYNLSLLFYPVLLIFWFIPKTVLNKGKIYLLSSYANFIYTRITRVKSTILHFVLITGLILLLSIVNNDTVRIVSMIYFSFLYYKIVIKYVKQSFQPAQLFGTNVDQTLDQLIKSPDQAHSIIKSFEENKTDDKLSENERYFTRVKRLVIANTIVEFLGANLSGFKGKRAFVISWIFQLIGFILITFCFYTFINIELFNVDPTNYKITRDPSVFDFIYYTFKTIAFGNIESIYPVGVLARIIEILSFCTIGIFILILVISVIFSLGQDKIEANVQKAIQVCDTQNKIIAERLQLNYSVDIDTVLKEAVSIRKSVENIKRSIERIL